MPKRSKETCYMCSKARSSREHVPPSCFFPKPAETTGDADYRKNLITVPSCDLHNSSKSSDDEYLLAIIAAHYENNQTAYLKYSGALKRALQKSPGLMHLIAAGAQYTYLGGQRTIALKLDTNRVLRTLANYSRALHFHEFGQKCLSGVQVHSPQIHGDGIQQRPEVTALCAVFDQLLGDAPATGDNPDVFSYKAGRHGDLVVFRLEFYGGFSVYTMWGPNVEGMEPDA